MGLLTLGFLQQPASGQVAVAAIADDTSIPGASSVDASVPAQASPQPTALPARLSLVEGPVRVLSVPPQSTPSTASQGTLPPPPPADELFHDATANMPVLAGMQVETGDDGRAELQFDDGSIVRLTPGSAVVIESLAAGGEQLRAMRGLSYYELPEQSGGALSVQVGPDAVRVPAASLLRVDLDSTPYQVAALRGSAHVNSPGSDVGFEISMGQTATLDPASVTAYDLQPDLAASSWDAWNTDRDSAVALMAANQTNARVGNGDAASASWNDLDYYGTWYNVPGAGMAWAPDGVDANFDPYGQGAWGYYTGVGYTWISAYPWGWLPYHCGGWSYFNGFGWLWQPGGGCGGFGGVGWYPYTGVHHAPRDYRMPRGPLDPRLRARLASGVPIPRAMPLTTVERGPAFQFRQLGGSRPEPRVLPLNRNPDSAPVYAATLPVAPVGTVQAYRSGGSAFAGGGTGASPGPQAQHTAPFHMQYTPPGIVSPPTHLVAPQARAIAPAPHIEAPPAHVAAPPAARPK
ncbi:FecR family protein [Acidipila sp. EB88]|uniref:FecR family protein n=1 Tax=Acidipila sp. EB88 TaxID=2305226 RepID=UPI001315688F|nr:FecR family protein [Acidipila sp. EB88]